VPSSQGEPATPQPSRRVPNAVGELSTRSEEFRVRWGAHNVKEYRSRVKQFHHPLVGDLTLVYEALGLPAARGEPAVRGCALRRLAALDGNAIRVRRPPPPDTPG